MATYGMSHTHHVQREWRPMVTSYTLPVVPITKNLLLAPPGAPTGATCCMSTRYIRCAKPAWRRAAGMHEVTLVFVSCSIRTLSAGWRRAPASRAQRPSMCMACAVRTLAVRCNKIRVLSDTMRTCTNAERPIDPGLDLLRRRMPEHRSGAIGSQPWFWRRWFLFGRLLAALG